MPDPDMGPFFQLVYESVQKKAEELKEYGVVVDIVMYSNDIFDPIYDVLKKTIASSPSGVAIVVAPTSPFTDALALLRKKNIPFVNVNMDIEDSGRIAYVGGDNIRSGVTGAGLIRMMATPESNIAVFEINNDYDYGCITQRSRSFFETMVKFGLKDNIRAVLYECNDDCESYAIARSYLAEIRIPTLFMPTAAACMASVVPLKLSLKSGGPSWCATT